MYIAVGQNKTMMETKFDQNLRYLIKSDLLWFYLGNFIFSLFVFVLLALAIERQTQKRIIKPICELTKQIKNPKNFQKTQNNSSVMVNRNSENSLSRATGSFESGSFGEARDGSSASYSVGRSSTGGGSLARSTAQTGGRMTDDRDSTMTARLKRWKEKNKQY